MAPNFLISSEKEPSGSNPTDLISLKNITNGIDTVDDENHSVMTPSDFYPTLTSTPTIPAAHIYYRRSKPLESFSRIRKSSRQFKQSFPIMDLPVLVLDKMFALLSDEDLRAVHQVSHTWKTTLECRAIDNSRRLKLVQKIRENKENFMNGSKKLSPLNLNHRVNIDRACDMKLEDMVFIECTNLINTSNTSLNNDNTTGNRRLTDTPRYAFQSSKEKERSPTRDQKSFRCRRCSYTVPVTLPVLKRSRSNEEIVDVTKSRIEVTTTGFRRTSRMETLPREDRKLRDRKKSRPASMSPNAYRKIIEFEYGIFEQGEDKSYKSSQSRMLSVSFIDTENDKSSCNIYDSFRSEDSFLQVGNQSYFTEMSANRYKMDLTLSNDSGICKTQSFKSFMNENENTFSESSISCPNLNESFVQVCPNPNCHFRVCSNCSMGEHPGKPCRIIDSDSFENLEESKENEYFCNFSQTIHSKNMNSYESLKKRESQYISKSNKKNCSKKLLRRLAKL